MKFSEHLSGRPIVKKISVSDMRRSERSIVRFTQKEKLPNLRDERHTDTNNGIKKLSPFIDENNLVRAVGRLSRYSAHTTPSTSCLGVLIPQSPT